MDTSVICYWCFAHGDRPSGPLCHWNPSSSPLQQPSWGDLNLTLPSHEAASSTWASCAHVCQRTTCLLLLVGLLWLRHWADGPLSSTAFRLSASSSHIQIMPDGWFRGLSLQFSVLIFKEAQVGKSESVWPTYRPKQPMRHQCLFLARLPWSLQRIPWSLFLLLEGGDRPPAFSRGEQKENLSLWTLLSQLLSHLSGFLFLCSSIPHCPHSCYWLIPEPTQHQITWSSEPVHHRKSHLLGLPSKDSASISPFIIKS